jgi:hypothetical protein
MDQFPIQVVTKKGEVWLQFQQVNPPYLTLTKNGKVWSQTRHVYLSTKRLNISSFDCLLDLSHVQLRTKYGEVQLQPK